MHFSTISVGDNLALELFFDGTVYLLIDEAWLMLHSEQEKQRILSFFAKYHDDIYAIEQCVNISRWNTEDVGKQTARAHAIAASDNHPLKKHAQKTLAYMENNLAREWQQAQLSKEERRQKRERNKINADRRRRIVDKADNQCEVCGAKEYLEVHHKLPIAEGGYSNPENLQVLCHECHLKETIRWRGFRTENYEH